MQYNVEVRHQMCVALFILDTIKVGVRCCCSLLLKEDRFKDLFAPTHYFNSSPNAL